MKKIIFCTSTKKLYIFFIIFKLTHCGNFHLNVKKNIYLILITWKFSNFPDRLYIRNMCHYFTWIAFCHNWIWIIFRFFRKTGATRHFSMHFPPNKWVMDHQNPHKITFQTVKTQFSLYFFAILLGKCDFQTFSKFKTVWSLMCSIVSAYKIIAADIFRFKGATDSNAGVLH